MPQAPQPVRVPDLLEKKKRGEKIAVLTAYDATMARLLDCAGVDVILVGDSLGMVIMGHKTTLEVTLDMMVHHTRAVVNGCLLYTSDAADERSSVDLGGRRIIKKKR